MKRIIITGATGLIGSKIAEKLIKRGDEVIIFSRYPERAKSKIVGAYDYKMWDYNIKKDWAEAVKNADAVVHLAGEDVMGSRWNNKHKNKIMDSRKFGTKNIVDAICENNLRCKSFICASAIGFYNNDINIEVNESSPPGNDFLAKVVSCWENEAAQVKRCGVRSVIIRIGIVLSKEGGALAKMITPFKFFVGGPLGKGNQWMSWIHIDDVVNLFIYSLDNDIEGVLNAVSPNPVKMNDFAEELGRTLNKPSFFRVPEFMLNLILGEAVGVVTKGSKVIPKKTKEIGFRFMYENLQTALTNLLK